MPAAFALSHSSFCRASIAETVLLKRFCVLSPSDSKITTFEYLKFESSAGALSGDCCSSDSQPHAMPIAWLVLPDGLIASTLAFKAVQS